MGFSTRKLAYVLHSLVRVSRRVSRSHFDKISFRTLRPYATVFWQDFLLPGGVPISVSDSRDLILSSEQEKVADPRYHE